MGEIVKLSESSKNKLAAGEVIERPSSALKELVENSIDAGSSLINIDIYGGGIKKLSVYDNGKGFLKEDLDIAFERHTTSKIKQFEDIFQLKTFGFRGEALASIAAVSKVTVTTKHFSEEIGSQIRIEGGKKVYLKEVPFEKGTLINVEDLFFNTPARLKFLKSPSSELKQCVDIIERCALANPNISFKLNIDGKQSFFTPGDNNLTSAILSLYGTEIYKNLVEINFEFEKGRIYGYFVQPAINRSNRTGYFFYVNRRPVKNRIISLAIDEAFKNNIMANRFPIIFLFIDINPEDIDINVHPQKSEVKFVDERLIFKLIMLAINDAFENRIKITNIQGITHANTDKKELINLNSDEFDNIQLHQNINNKLNSSNNSQKTLFDNNYLGVMTGINNEYTPIKTHQQAFNINSNKQEEIIVNQVVNIDQNDQIKIVGYLFNTYIAVQKSDLLYLIDQHAVHEREIYNNLKKMFNEGSILRQQLLSPIILNLTNKEKIIVLGNLDLFNKLGFEIEDFGSNTIAIRTQPLITTKIKIKVKIEDIISELLLEKDNNDLSRFIDDILKKLSCSLAIKGGDYISDFDKNYIVKLALEENILFCPHGRPTTLELSRTQIEKYFKRR
ncbi:DNA mismatch repair endonuclease MutL [Caldicellulosiruptoraceae bacterium PP1]